MKVKLQLVAEENIDKDGKYAGSMNYQNANKSVNLPDGIDGQSLMSMLDSIIAEIKSTLVE